MRLEADEFIICSKTNVGKWNNSFDATLGIEDNIQATATGKQGK